MNASEFINKHQLGFHVERVADRPDDFCNWERTARHWSYSFRTLTTDRHVSGFFTQGSAHTEDPTAADVLGSLALDSLSAEDACDVLEFANEFGYDLDTDEGQDRARKVYAACGDALRDLTNMLGGLAMTELWEIDFDE